MGTWGTGLYHDDTALDVKDRFEEMLKRGMTPEEATAKIVEMDRELLADKDDQIVFWLALAEDKRFEIRLIGFTLFRKVPKRQILSHFFTFTFHQLSQHFTKIKDT